MYYMLDDSWETGGRCSFRFARECVYGVAWCAQVRQAAAMLARSVRGVTLRLCDASVSSAAGAIPYHLLAPHFSLTPVVVFAPTDAFTLYRAYRCPSRGGAGASSPAAAGPSVISTGGGIVGVHWPQPCACTYKLHVHALQVRSASSPLSQLLASPRQALR
jgi:hypothetical protein